MLFAIFLEYFLSTPKSAFKYLNKSQIFVKVNVHMEF